MRLVNAKTLADLFGVTVATVHTWTRQRRIPCVRPTQATVRYSIEAVEQALVRPAGSTGSDARRELNEVLTSTRLRDPVEGPENQRPISRENDDETQRRKRPALPG